MVRYLTHMARQARLFWWVSSKVGWGPVVWGKNLVVPSWARNGRIEDTMETTSCVLSCLSPIPAWDMTQM